LFEDAVLSVSTFEYENTRNAFGKDWLRGVEVLERIHLAYDMPRTIGKLGMSAV
jgi:hypothetical protein